MSTVDEERREQLKAAALASAPSVSGPMQEIGEVRFAVARSQQALADARDRRHVFHAGHAAATVPVRTDADMLGPDRLERMQEVLGKVFEAGARRRILLLERAASFDVARSVFGLN